MGAVACGADQPQGKCVHRTPWSARAAPGDQWEARRPGGTCRNTSPSSAAPFWLSAGAPRPLSKFCFSAGGGGAQGERI